MKIPCNTLTNGNQSQLSSNCCNNATENVKKKTIERRSRRTSYITENKNRIYAVNKSKIRSVTVHMDSSGTYITSTTA